MPSEMVVLCTAGSEEEAGRVARHLVEQRLAACVNVIPSVRSIYRWQGKVEEATEWLLLIKSRRERLAEIEAGIRQVHSYEVPEVVALPIEGGAAKYLAWLREESGAAGGN
jgi:periplasmic divalent cation tolerance protein